MSEFCAINCSIRLTTTTLFVISPNRIFIIFCMHSFKELIAIKCLAKSHARFISTNYTLQHLFIFSLLQPHWYLVSGSAVWLPAGWRAPALSILEISTDTCIKAPKWRPCTCCSKYLSQAWWFLGTLAHTWSLEKWRCGRWYLLCVFISDYLNIQQVVPIFLDWCTQKSKVHG